MTYRLQTTDRTGATGFFVVTVATLAQAQGDARRLHAERYGVDYADVTVTEPALHPLDMPVSSNLDSNLSRWSVVL